jgi:hypothetical protein
MIGTFGTAILQLPVKCGHDGGNFHVKYNGRQASFEDDLDCDQLFSLSSFYNSCEFVMNPVTRGWKLTLVFNLVWTNFSIMMPTDFLVFLNSQKKLDSALLPWNPHRNKDDYSTEVQQFPLLKENVKIPVITSIDEKKVPCSVIALNDSAESEVCSSIEDSEDSENEIDYDRNSDYSECEDKEDCHCDVNNPTVMMCEEEDVLFFVLEEKYLENSLMFHHLQGNDRILADLLRCCPVIDVHLAKVTHTNRRHRKFFESGSLYPETTSTNTAKISRLIDADGVVKDLHIDQLNWNEKCVGPRNWLESPRIQPDKEIKIMKRN